MIVKGKARGAGGQLGAYLIDNGKQENERIDVLEVRSGLTRDAKTALRDMDFATEKTKGKHGLYHCVLNPAPGEKLTAEQWQQAVNTLEKEIGFDGQNRVLVMHEKQDKNGQTVQHVHAVWQRERDGKMLELSKNYQKHDKAREKIEVDLDLSRTRQTKDTKQALSDLWAETSDGREFIEAAQKQGFTVAQGERRAYKVQTPEGKIVDLARQLPREVKTRDVAERLQGVDLVHEKELVGQKPQNDRQQEKARRLSQEAEKNSTAAPSKDFAGEKEKTARHQHKADQFREAANDNVQSTEPTRAERTMAKLEAMKTQHQERAATRAHQAGQNFDDVARQTPANENDKTEEKPPMTRAERAAETLRQMREGKEGILKEQATKTLDDITLPVESEIEKRLRLTVENKQDFGLEHEPL